MLHTIINKLKQTFRKTNTAWFNLYDDFKVEKYFYSFTCSCPVFPESLFEETVFSSLYILASLVLNWLTNCTGLFLGSLYCSIDLCVCFCASIIPICFFFNYYSFVVSSKVKENDSSSSFLSHDYFNYWGSFLLVYKC